LDGVPVVLMTNLFEKCSEWFFFWGSKISLMAARFKMAPKIYIFLLKKKTFVMDFFSMQKSFQIWKNFWIFWINWELKTFFYQNTYDSQCTNDTSVGITAYLHKIDVEVIKKICILEDLLFLFSVSFRPIKRLKISMSVSISHSAICLTPVLTLNLHFFWRGETWLVVNTCPLNDL
jgi:hypothetical protein